MISAFGIDHGEISKASLGGLGMKIGGAFAGAGQGLRRSGMASMKMGRMATERANSVQPSLLGRTRGQAAMGQGMQRGGAAKVKAGGMLRSLGQGMQARPKLTGGVAAAGIGAGTGGAAAGLFGNRRRF